MNFKDFSRNQSLLLPPSYEAFLGESHEAVILAEFIDNLDLASLEAEYRNDHGGASAYHPVMLLSVLVYGYMNGAFSSRKIAKCLRQDLGFMYLAAGSVPDFRTLARFRKEKGVRLESVLKQVVGKARELGFVSFGTVSLDGTKIYASANRDRNETRDELEQKIRGLVNEAERIDRLEDEEFGDAEDGRDAELKTKEGRARRRTEVEEKRIKTEARLRIHEAVAGSASAQVNATDPDARLMMMKRGDFANGYNVQIMTENGFVLASHVADTSADQRLLVPTLRSFEMIHGARPGRLLADKGYSGEQNYAFCEEQGIDAYIPPHKTPLDLAEYAYDPERDAYTDAAARRFAFKQRMREGDCWYRVYMHVDPLTKKRKYLNVCHEWRRHAHEQIEKLASARGRTVYKRRRYDVEGAFGNIKHNLRFTAFRLRGIHGAAIEWNLVSLAHDIKKML